MATYNKFNSFVEALAEKSHNLGSDQLKVALTNTAPVATNTVYANLTSPLATTNLVGATPFNITTTTSSQTSGTYKLVLTDLVLTASGNVGPFRYVVLYNDTATNDELIGWYDYGTSITLLNGETFTIDFDAAAGVITLV
ncbi:MAG: hypothetical protein WC666_03905 [Candidatus Paceibacterota bacterium]|jgi:hypothetical protein